MRIIREESEETRGRKKDKMVLERKKESKNEGGD